MALFNSSTVPRLDAMNADNFYCQNVQPLLTGFHETQNITCLSAIQFAGSSFPALCPSGNCWQDCRNISRLFQVLPDGTDLGLSDPIYYGAASHSDTPTSVNVTETVTLYGLCLGLANMSRAVESLDIAVEQERTLLKYLLPSPNDDQSAVATAVSECLSATCEHAKNPESCMHVCTNLLVNSTTPNLLSTSDCLYELCNDVYNTLPYANQDVVGIGVTLSFVLQPLLVMFSCLGLFVASLRERSKNQSLKGRRSLAIFLESLESFQLAQCYYTIPVAVASLILDPAELDAVNAAALLPAAIDCFLPPIFTLMLLHYNGKTSWYRSMLTLISWILSSIVIGELAYSVRWTFNLRDAEVHSLASIDSCGSSNAFSLCYQTQNITPLIYYSDNYVALKALAPVIWSVSTISLFILLTEQFISGRLPPPSQRKTGRGSWWRRTWVWILTLHTSSQVQLVLVYVTSFLFLAAIAAQGWLFVQNIPMMNWREWAFGQVIAVTVWIPPVFDYLHLQFEDTIDNLRQKLQPSRAGSKLKSRVTTMNTTYNPDTRHESMSSQLSLEVVDDDRFSFESNDDRAPLSSAVDPRPNAFELRSRPTLRMEQGS